VKIANETKVGAIAVVSVALLILGFNFLKGKKLFTKSTVLYANYDNIQGLQKSNPILINGLQVGTVFDIRTDKNMRNILVELNITKDVYIPVNSIAIIKPNPISTPSLEIKLGDATTHLASKDTIITEASGGIFGSILEKVDPVLFQVKKSITSLDTLLMNFNTILDPEAKNNIGATLKNLNAVTASMLQSTASLQILLNTQTGSLAKSLANVESITRNFAGTNDKFTNVVTNLDKTTTKLSQLELEKAVNTLNATLSDLKNMVAKMNSTDGSLGRLVNDPKLYNNLASTGNKLNLLLDDIRVNPKRYVNISVFGKKQNNSPLLVPLPDTLNAPYYIEKIKIDK
jgi:phospholipid/cholesterol/gamma-HCH transport system substrate-binding protein